MRNECAIKVDSLHNAVMQRCGWAASLDGNCCCRTRRFADGGKVQRLRLRVSVVFLY